MTIVNPEAEAAVLGAVLLDGAIFKELHVQEHHFHSAKHQRIYRVMKLTFKQEAVIDMVTVTTNLGKSIYEVGGTTYLLEMAESVTSTTSIRHYERLVLEAYRLRKTQERTLRYSANPNEEDLGELIVSLKELQGVGVEKQEKTTYDHLLDITEAIFSPQDEESSGFQTSYTDFDNMLGGLQRGDLIVVGARPSVGKTAFALNLASGHCRNGGRAEIFSLEMGSRQLLQRIISAEAHINGQKWRSMAFSEQDYESAVEAIGEISDWNLTIHQKKRTISDITAAVRKAVHDEHEKKPLVIIDYLQLVTPIARYDNRNQAIGAMTRELKLLAMELDIPIIVLSQLSRGVESRPNKRPFLSDLRESGDIEQDADVITFLYREDYYEKESKGQDTMEIIISKHRNGPTGTVELAFLKEYGRFTNKTYCSEGVLQNEKPSIYSLEKSV